MARVMVSLTDKHLAIWQALAIDNKTSKSGFLRSLIEEAAIRKTGYNYDALYDMLMLQPEARIIDMISPAEVRLPRLGQ